MLGVMVWMFMIDGGLGFLVFVVLVFYYIVINSIVIGSVEDVLDFVVW